MDTLVSLVLYLIVLGAICWLLWWLIGFIGIPEPFAKIARGAVAVIGVLLLISVLLSLLGYHQLSFIPLRK